MFEFNNILFSMGEVQFFDCQFGQDYKCKSRMKQLRGGGVCLQTTQKKGCPAHITIREFILYPDYKIVPTSDMSKNQIQCLKKTSLHDLQLAQDSRTDIKTISKYYVCLPSEEAHHDVHSTKGPMSLAQRIHPVLIQRIHELVAKGVTETNEVKRSFRVYVKHLNTDDIINQNDRSYNPTDKDISNHVYIAKMKLQLSSLDQGNAYMKIEAWKKLNSQASFFLGRMYR